jgi:acetoacetyl-CoA synthetase
MASLLMPPSSAAEDYLLTLEQLPFEHHLYLLYSSGTSGPPKCLMHTAGVGLYFTDNDSVFKLSWRFGPWVRS